MYMMIECTSLIEILQLKLITITKTVSNDFMALCANQNVHSL